MAQFETGFVADLRFGKMEPLLSDCRGVAVADAAATRGTLTVRRINFDLIAEFEKRVVQAVKQLGGEFPLAAPERGAGDAALRECAQNKLRALVEAPRFEAIAPLLRDGNAADVIVSAAEGERADLIVISTHGLGGWRHLVFGLVAEKVIRLAPCPVLVTHAIKSTEKAG